MSQDDLLEELRRLIQVDPGGRGLARLPGPNLFTACAADLTAACRRLAALKVPSRIGLFTGFYIASAGAGETDGPPGAILLAHALEGLGHAVTFFSDPHTLPALRLAARRLRLAAPLLNLADIDPWGAEHHDFDVLIAIERPGPAADGVLRSMTGRDISPFHGPAHVWFARSPVPTIGVGDGGNEIGMGKLPSELIADHIPLGREIACRTATTELIVAGVSNWGGYALAAGVLACTARWDLARRLDPRAETELWAEVIPAAGLVNAATGRAELAVDGLDWSTYIRPLTRMHELLARR
jgi:hypothetical protein